jgi:hypothetical protein
MRDARRLQPAGPPRVRGSRQIWPLEFSAAVTVPDFPLPVPNFRLFMHWRDVPSLDPENSTLTGRVARLGLLICAKPLLVREEP